jgi:hypothetical protein
MYLTELWASCRRRWKILLVLLAVSASLCWVVAGKIAPTYEANATLVLVPPRNIENPEANRYLDLGSLTDSVDVLARSMGSAETVDALEARAPGAHYEVLADETTSAPILLVTASGPDEQSAAAMLAAVLQRVKVNLAKLQRSIQIKAPYQITLMRLSKDPEPKASLSSRLRVLGTVAAGLVLASAFATAALDGLLRRRESKAQVSEAPARDPDERDSDKRGPDRPGPGQRGPDKRGPDKRASEKRGDGRQASDGPTRARPKGGTGAPVTRTGGKVEPMRVPPRRPRGSSDDVASLGRQGSSR